MTFDSRNPQGTSLWNFSDVSPGECGISSWQLIVTHHNTDTDILTAGDIAGIPGVTEDDRSQAITIVLSLSIQMYELRVVREFLSQQGRLMLIFDNHEYHVMCIS